ncbi:MAG: hypothetical protein IPK26_10970 [Planctomycetes bacterium]|nr:hypothetical protein [Planctomycetota bacterium]
MNPKPLGEVLRKVGWWLDVVERHGHSADVLHNHFLDLIACVAHREECTPEVALDLLRRGYLLRTIEDVLENNSRRHPPASTKEQCNRD